MAYLVGGPEVSRVDGEAAGVVFATVSTARLDKQKRGLSWVIVGLRVEAVVTLQASAGARTANIAGWRGCGWDWGTAAAWRRRGAGPIQCTMLGADRTHAWAKRRHRGPKAVADGLGRREGANVGERGCGAIAAYLVGGPRGFGVTGRQASLNLKQL